MTNSACQENLSKPSLQLMVDITLVSSVVVCSGLAGKELLALTQWYRCVGHWVVCFIVVPLPRPLPLPQAATWVKECRCNPVETRSVYTSLWEACRGVNRK